VLGSAQRKHKPVKRAAEIILAKVKLSRPLHGLRTNNSSPQQ
jgi:hypothetical protein